MIGQQRTVDTLRSSNKIPTAVFVFASASLHILQTHLIKYINAGDLIINSL